MTVAEKVAYTSGVLLMVSFLIMFFNSSEGSRFWGVVYRTVFVVSIIGFISAIWLEGVA